MKYLSNAQLLNSLKETSREERALTVRIIELLEEVARRDLFREMGYPTLQTFCERELGYSPGSAARRIAAMRVVRDVPEAKPLLESGRVTLETLQAVQIQSRKEKFDTEEKRELVHAITDKTKDEVRTIIQPEKLRTLTLSEAEFELLQELKKRLGTSKLEVILRESLKHISPRNGETVRESKTRKPTASQKRALFQKAVCAIEGCREKVHLEADHIVPWSKGGATTLSNLQLLCSAHNKLKSYEQTRPYLTGAP